VRALGSAIATFVLPGFGQAIARRASAAIAWALGVAIAHALVFATPWAFYAAFALRFACAVHAAACIRKGVALDWLAPLALGTAAFSILMFVALRWVFAGHQTPSSSMAPTLEIGDDIFLDTITPRLRPLERGEPIVFADPCRPSEDMVKRVVAIGGAHRERPRARIARDVQRERALRAQRDLLGLRRNHGAEQGDARVVGLVRNRLVVRRRGRADTRIGACLRGRVRPDSRDRVRHARRVGPQRGVGELAEIAELPVGRVRPDLMRHVDRAPRVGVLVARIGDALDELVRQRERQHL
jgi:hypothetical protein